MEEEEGEWAAETLTHWTKQTTETATSRRYLVKVCNVLSASAACLPYEADLRIIWADRSAKPANDETCSTYFIRRLCLA
ncbi:hypothetical protein EVAR_30875_1 [Eumeta japonica]|uniref:Uncharacterized protein n=1 Tax=Eumeta variegata TaxID=151549 RepID=A0A4C1V4T5_EUMVA|nr:hypothetical protein EVAR_30875_1 [Eumeta japonica]